VPFFLFCFSNGTGQNREVRPSVVFLQAVAPFPVVEVVPVVGGPGAFHPSSSRNPEEAAPENRRASHLVSSPQVGDPGGESEVACTVDPPEASQAGEAVRCWVSGRERSENTWNIRRDQPEETEEEEMNEKRGLKPELPRNGRD